MLVPIPREEFEQLVPIIATGAQYQYYWGKPADLLKRALISVVAVIVVCILTGVIGENLRLLFGIVAGLYWLWAPILWASLRNRQTRNYPYSGFWQGRVRDVYITEDLIGTEESVNQNGQLIIVENRERRINLDVIDREGFSVQVQAPLKRTHRPIRTGDLAELLVLSTRRDLGRIDRVSDIYIPNHDLWVSDYPVVQHDAFVELSRDLQSQSQPPRNHQGRRPPSQRRRSRPDDRPRRSSYAEDRDR
jgi:hypothetical protein